MRKRKTTTSRIIRNTPKPVSMAQREAANAIALELYVQFMEVAYDLLHEILRWDTGKYESITDMINQKGWVEMIENDDPEWTAEVDDLLKKATVAHLEFYIFQKWASKT